MKGKNTLEDDHIGPVHGFRLALTTMCHKIIDRNFHLSALLQLGEHVQQQLDVEGIRVIEVIFVDQGLLMLFLIKDLQD